VNGKYRLGGTGLVMQNLALYEISAKENGAGQHSPLDVDPSGGAVSPLALGFRKMNPLVQLRATLGPSFRENKESITLRHATAI
jgi:hypothetical protein